ncbi:MAG: hypothetical protein JOZ66_15000 [Hyphomicrobiales bacterium]|nr:hypothetical protein [Hyphomicrobiales bacterium]
MTVTATDTVTNKSTSTSFDFIGFGQDKTLPPGSFPSNGSNDTVLIPQLKVLEQYEKVVQSAPGQSFQSLAALITQYAAAGFKNEHVGAGQMISFADRQGDENQLSMLANHLHHG